MFYLFWPSYLRRINQDAYSEWILANIYRSEAKLTLYVQALWPSATTRRSTAAGAAPLDRRRMRKMWRRRTGRVVLHLRQIRQVSRSVRVRCRRVHATRLRWTTGAGEWYVVIHGCGPGCGERAAATARCWVMRSIAAAVGVSAVAVRRTAAAGAARWQEGGTASARLYTNTASTTGLLVRRGSLAPGSSALFSSTSSPSAAVSASPTFSSMPAFSLRRSALLLAPLTASPAGATAAPGWWLGYLRFSPTSTGLPSFVVAVSLDSVGGECSFTTICEWKAFALGKKISHEQKGFT